MAKKKIEITSKVITEFGDIGEVMSINGKHVKVALLLDNKIEKCELNDLTLATEDQILEHTKKI